MRVFGYHDRDHGGHAELAFHDVRVPASNIIGAEGEGFAIAQARLGPGRIHHCMRSIGIAERAIEMMCQRASSRVAFGKPIADQGVVRDWIAESRVRIEQLRLLVLKAAWLMDEKGNRGAHTEIQAIKIATPATVEWILDKAIQVHGAGGLSQDFPLAEWFAGMRTLRFADGPDEVHKASLARAEIRKHRGTRGNASAIVTGAAGGIGEAIAQRLLERGASSVVLTDLDADRLEVAADRLSNSYPAEGRPPGRRRHGRRAPARADVARRRPVLRQRRRLPRVRARGRRGRVGGQLGRQRDGSRPGGAAAGSALGGAGGLRPAGRMLRQHRLGGRPARRSSARRRTRPPSTRRSASPSGWPPRTATAACRCAASARWACAPT